ncbi:MAG TPA: hypothetical protein VKA46_28620 [Gemmataceae bacterium]|nr:hypothetical protein [Gemmataceae bacterium]
MSLTTETLIADDPSDPAMKGDVAETLTALRQQLAVLEEQVSAVNRQQAALRTAINHLRARFPEAGPVAETGGGQPMLQRCAGDVVRVLREVGRPLGTLELLEEMALRHLSWRENTVRHVLADLKNEGVVREGDGERPLSYSLAHH